MSAWPAAVYWSCTRKVPYRHRKTARDAATRQARKFGVTFTAYLCSQCGCYHLAKAK